MISVLYNDTYVFSLSVSIEFLRMSISISLDKNSHMCRDGCTPLSEDAWNTLEVMVGLRMQFRRNTIEKQRKR